MSASYHRLSLRFRNETKRRLAQLQLEMRETLGRPISTSRLVESLVEQFLDRHSPETRAGKKNLEERLLQSNEDAV